MNPALPIGGAVILAAILITVVVPGGVFVVPVLILAAVCWAAYRYLQGRRSTTGEQPEERSHENTVGEEPIH